MITRIQNAVVKNGRAYFTLPAGATGTLTLRKAATASTLASEGAAFSIPASAPADVTGPGYQGGLPRLTLNMAPAALAAVTKDAKVTVSGTFANGYGSAYTERTGSFTIKGRGNTSWTYPQKPYALGLLTSDNKDDKTSLFGMYADNDVVLLANYADPTGGLRTYMVQQLAANLGLVAVKTRPLEVYLANGDYVGLYTVTEKVKNSLVALAAPTASGATPDSFGYMYETVLDFQETLATENYFKTDLFGNTYPGPTHMGDAHSVLITYPKYGKLTSAQAAYAEAKWRAMEASLAHPWSDTAAGPQSTLDKAALFAFIVAVEWSRSVDMVSHSFDAYVQPNGKMRFIPWDYDLAFPTYTMYAFEGNSATAPFISRCPIFKSLFADADFCAEFNDYYQATAAAAVANALELGKQRAQLLLDTGAIARNLERWGTTTSDLAVFISSNGKDSRYDIHLQAALSFAGTRANAMAARYKNVTKMFADSVVEQDNAAGVSDTVVPNLQNVDCITTFSVANLPTLSPVGSNVIDMLLTFPQADRQSVNDVAFFSYAEPYYGISLNSYGPAIWTGVESRHAMDNNVPALIESTVYNNNGNANLLRVNGVVQTLAKNADQENRAFSDVIRTGGGIYPGHDFRGYVKNFCFVGNLSEARRDEIRAVLRTAYPALPA